MLFQSVQYSLSNFLFTDPSASVPKPAEAIVVEDEPAGPVKVTVPSQDDSSLDSFFTSRTLDDINADKVDVDISMFDEIFIDANDM